MIAFDTDVLTELLLGNERYVVRAQAIAANQQCVPVIIVEEIMRGRLATIRDAESQRGRVTLDRAYGLFQRTFADLREVLILPYTSTAEAQYRQWRAATVKGSSHDLRIAAICVTAGAILITRNRRDFEDVPDFKVEFWS